MPDDTIVNSLLRDIPAFTALLVLTIFVLRWIAARDASTQAAIVKMIETHRNCLHDITREHAATVDKITTDHKLSLDGNTQALRELATTVTDLRVRIADRRHGMTRPDPPPG